MSRTAKWEHKSDTYRIGHRLEIKARPAGRLTRELEEQAAAAEPDPPTTLYPYHPPTRKATDGIRSA